MEDKIREIILSGLEVGEIKSKDGTDIFTIFDRWVSNILALDEIVEPEQLWK